MRVLHIHRAIGPAGGDAGVSMHRLHRMLLRLGVDSKILVLDGAGDAPDVSRLPRVDTFSLERRLRSLTRRLGLNDVHRLGSFQLDRHTFFQNADVVHFHGLHSGVFSYLALPRAAATKPCLMTLHDTWAFTGHCAYSYECDRWKAGCGACPWPEEEPAIARDATRLEWRMKSRSFLKSGTRLISKSTWSTRMARVSTLRHLPLAEIPYGVDTGVYRPRGRPGSRQFLGLPQDRFVLLVSARDLTKRRHGMDLLTHALSALPPDLASRCVLLVMGKGATEITHGTAIPVRDLGCVEDDHLRAIAYSAADLHLYPTRADVFGLDALESQACGTPVVAFRVGGVPDHVKTGQSGFLVEPEDALGFRDGIALLLENEPARLRMSGPCRSAVVESYDLSLEATRHAELYEAIVFSEIGTPGERLQPLVPPYPATETREPPAATPGPKARQPRRSPVASDSGPD